MPWGPACTNWLAKQVPSLVGIALASGSAVVGPGFAGVLALLGVLLSLLFDRATWIATGAAATAAIAAFALPLKLNILVAIAAAVAVGLLIRRWSTIATRPSCCWCPLKKTAGR